MDRGNANNMGLNESQRVCKPNTSMPTTPASRKPINNTLMSQKINGSPKDVTLRKINTYQQEVNSHTQTEGVSTIRNFIITKISLPWNAVMKSVELRGKQSLDVSVNAPRMDVITDLNIDTQQDKADNYNCRNGYCSGVGEKHYKSGCNEHISSRASMPANTRKPRAIYSMPTYEIGSNTNRAMHLGNDDGKSLY